MCVHLLVRIINHEELTHLSHGAQSSSEVNRFSASQEIPRNFWNPNAHHRMYNSPPSVPILSQIHLVNDPPPFQFLNIHLNIILPSTPWSSMWSLYLRFPNVSPV